MNDYIPDPIEIMERQMERQMDLVDENNTYPCVQCSKRFPVDHGFPCDDTPSASLVCPDCAPEWFKKI